MGHDLLLKIIIMGNYGVGKTSLLERYFTGNFMHKMKTTIGADFRIKIIDVEGKRVKLQIWDTAGQERFRTITRSYYKGAAIGIICADLSIEGHDTFQKSV